MRFPERWRWAMILGCPLLGAGLYLAWAWARSGAGGLLSGTFAARIVYVAEAGWRSRLASLVRGLTFTPGMTVCRVEWDVP